MANILFRLHYLRVGNDQGVEYRSVNNAMKNTQNKIESSRQDGLLKVEALHFNLSARFTEQEEVKHQQSLKHYTSPRWLERRCTRKEPSTRSRSRSSKRYFWSLSLRPHGTHSYPNGKTTSCVRGQPSNANGLLPSKAGTRPMETLPVKSSRQSRSVPCSH